MSAPSSAAASWYGAYELKRFYQKNMTMGVLLAAALHLAIVGGWLGYQWWQSRADNFDDIPVVRISTLADIAPPPSMTTQKPQIAVEEPNIAPPSIGIPTPVADEEVIEEVKFATRAELAELSAPVVSEMSSSGSGDSVIVDIPMEEYFPSPDQFVVVEEQPVPIRRVEPVYPQIAELTGTEGTVYVQALVDKNGKVRDARIAKSSGSNVGFDEAALEAAYQNVYKPAIQNGEPVAVWVTYPVHFKLKQ